VSRTACAQTAKDLHLAVSAVAAVLARHVRIDSEEAVEIPEQVKSGEEGAEEEPCEDQAKEEE
jgi:hypothetical protein